jgi:hypothetical protein
MVTHAVNTDLQNQAYQRMNYWINHVLQDSVIISQDDQLLDVYQATGQRLIILPDSPVDQLLGMLMFVKLNAVMENQIEIIELEINSTAGDGMGYLHSCNESLGPFADAGWWSDPRPKWNDSKSKSAAKNVIQINRAPEWKDLDLDWSLAETSSESDVVFASFRKDETE